MTSKVKDFLDLVKDIRGTTFNDDGTPKTGFWAEIKAWHTAVIASKTAVDVGAAAAAANATTATTQASNASVSAATATTQAGIAITQASNASISAASAIASYDSFDDRYLGAKNLAPGLDNDGVVLLVGAIYWDTIIPAIRVWNGSVWVTFPTNNATIIGNTPAGNIVATTIQAAINELDVIKLGITAKAASSITSDKLTNPLVAYIGVYGISAYGRSVYSF